MSSFSLLFMAAFASSTTLVFLFIAITASWAAFASESLAINASITVTMSRNSALIPIESSVLFSWSPRYFPFSVTCWAMTALT